MRRSPAELLAAEVYDQLVKAALPQPLRVYDPRH
jgi:hypothetical protein